MFALFHYVQYEGSDFLGVFSTLELAKAAGAQQVAAYEADEAGGFFYGHLEVYPVELDQGFRVAYGQLPVWTYK